VVVGPTDPYRQVVNSSFYRYSSEEPILNSETGWTWQVRAGIGADNWSPWSPERPFTVEPVNTDCVDTGLVAYYPFDGNANDQSENELHGAVNTDGTSLTTDRFENERSAYLFGGGEVSDITVPHNELLNISSQITLVAWIYPETQKTQAIVRKGPSPRSVPYGLGLSGTGDFIFNATASGEELIQARDSGYPVRAWSFIAGTYDGTAMRLYVDGELKTTEPLDGELTLNSDPLLIGTRLNLEADTFHGKLDEIRIYNRALTDEEISGLYQQSRPPDER
jgi:hypothetical protein